MLKLFTLNTINRPIATILSFVGIMLFGAISIYELELSLLPTIEFPGITIITLLPDATPSEADSLITVPITEAINTVSGIKNIKSDSSEGISVITVKFNWSESAEKKSAEIRDKIDLIRGTLPDDAARPVVTSLSPTDRPIVELAILPGKEMHPDDLRDFFKITLKPLLDRIDGVAYVQISGGFRKEIHIKPDMEKLKSYNMDYSDIIASVRSQNINKPAGILKENAKEISIRINSEYKNIHDIENTVIKKGVLLNNIANVEQGKKDRKGYSGFNGKDSILVSIYKEPGKNSVFIADEVNRKLKEINQDYSDKVKSEIIYSESDLIRKSINNLNVDLLTGAVLSFLSLFILFKNPKSPLILLSCLPVSLLFTGLLFRLNHISLNIMSLGGLSIGIGMLFDSGNVILTSIERYKEKGFSPRVAAIKGTSEVIGSVISAVLTTIIVFLPVIFFNGILGAIFKEMALSISFSLGSSLLTSVTLIPVLSCMVKSSTGKNRQFKTGRFENAYLKVLNQVIRKPALLFLTVLILFAFSILYSLKLEREFFPDIEPLEVRLEMQWVPGSSIDSSIKLSEEFSRKIQTAIPSSLVISKIGYEEEDIFSLRNGKKNVNRIEFRIFLKDSDILSSKQAIELLKAQQIHSSNLTYHYSIPGDIFQNLLTGDNSPILLHLTGQDWNILHSLGGEIKNKLGSMHGFNNVKTSLDEKIPEMQVNFDSFRMMDYGLSGIEAGDFFKISVKGKTISTLKDGDRRTDIKLKSAYDVDKRSLSELFLKVRKNSYIKLSNIFTIKNEEGFGSLQRTGNVRINEIRANLGEIQKKEANSIIEDYISNVKLPPGYLLSFSGDKKELNDSQKEIGYSFLLALILIYLVLCGQFSSFLFPLVILLTVPLTLIGIVPVLFLTGKGINIAVLLGLILLLGIVVDNGALLYEYLEIVKKEKASLIEAVLESARITIKPILLNNGTTLLGMLPAAVFSEPGSEFQASLSITIVSGLIASVFLSLLVLPTVYYFLSLKTELTKDGIALAYASNR